MGERGTGRDVCLLVGARYHSVPAFIRMGLASAKE